MDNNQVSNTEYYGEVFLPKAIKWGRIVCCSAMVIFFLPFFVTWLFMGIEPDWGKLATASTIWLAQSVIWYVVEPLSYAPVLGIPGTFISFLAGNGSQIRMPCAIVSQKVAGVEPGTDEGSLMATIGISVSVFVNTIVLILGVLIGATALARLPESVSVAVSYMVPALYGSILATNLCGNEGTGAMAVVLGIGTTLAYRAGWFSWIPLNDVSWIRLLIPIFGTILVTYFMGMSKNKKIDENKNSPA